MGHVDEIAFSLDRGKIVSSEEISEKDYENICTSILKLPKTITTTHLETNISFNLNIEFLSFYYVKIEYRSRTTTLVRALLNLDKNFPDDVMEIMEWLDLNNFKKFLGDRKDVLIELIEI